MVRAQRKRQRQIAARMPLILRVPTEGIKSQPIPCDGRKILVQIREIRRGIPRVYPAEKKRPYRLRSNLSGAAEVEAVSREIRAQEAYSHAQFVFAVALHQVVRHLVRRRSRPRGLRVQKILSAKGRKRRACIAP